jgi:hypothetical protein
MNHFDLEMRTGEGMMPQVDARDVGQAVELVRALRAQLLQMSDQLAWIERRDVTLRNGRAGAMRIEAAALRRDIKNAQILIDRLQRRYLDDDGPPQARRLVRHPAR